jgi:Rieske 2Fe-2S family protein
MNVVVRPNPQSPLLNHCPKSLPAETYYAQEWFERDQKEIWVRHWIYICRDNDTAKSSMRRLSVAGENLILVKSREGEITCFHNTCRHRGSELCSVDEKKTGQLIVCPYHAWSYDLKGNLVRTGPAHPTADFRKEDHGLFSVHVKVHDGFVFVCLADSPPPFESAFDMGVDALKNWQLADLVTGYTMVKTMACNWKGFWENYCECLHCPGVHPGLCDRVPIYGKGIMSVQEAKDWTEDSVEPESYLKAGTKSWTVNGKPCGPEFPNLTDEQRLAGYHFVSMLPTAYIVAHVDFVRIVSMRPLTPETTELKAEFLFLPETLQSKDFDLHNAVDFVCTVIAEDTLASEINQRGVRSSKFQGGTLMPEEYDVYNFQQWVRRQLSL